MGNNSEAVWEAVIESTDLKVHRDLIHLHNLFIFEIKFERLDDLIIEILFKLPLTLLESIEVIEKVI